VERTDMAGRKAQYLTIPAACFGQITAPMGLERRLEELFRSHGAALRDAGTQRKS
jgi:hypothetical protein